MASRSALRVLLLLTALPLVVSSRTQAEPATNHPYALQSLESELSDLADAFSHCGDMSFEVMDGTPIGWAWSTPKQEWVEGTPRGKAQGMTESPPSNKMRIWPEVHGYDETKSLDEQPDAKAGFARTIANECFHWACPPHTGQPGNPGAPPSPPPDDDGRDKDCNDLNYAFHTAAALCKAAQAAAADGDRELCEVPKAAHEKVKARWNNEAYAEIAEKCACQEDPWDPEDEGSGDEFEDCPDFPSPPGDCDDEPYPNNQFIPDRDCDCGECEEGQEEGQ